MVPSTDVEGAAGTESRLAALLLATGSGTWEWDVAVAQVQLSREWLAILGYRPDEFAATPETVFDLVHPDDQPRARRKLLALFDGAAECECVGRLRRRDGTYQWRRERLAVAGRDADGRPQRVLGLGTNITDLGQAGERAHPWEHVFNQTQFGLSVTSIADDSIIAVNDAYARMHGYAVEELLGQSIGTTCELPSADLAQMIRRLNDDGHIVGEYAHTRKDGTSFPALHEITVVRDAQGVPVSRVGFVIDVSEREAGVAALRRSEERFRAVYRNASVGIGIGDVAGGIQEANPVLCALLGYSEDELQRLTFRALTHPDDQHTSAAQLARVLAGDASTELFEMRMRRRDGSAVWVQVGLSVIRDAAGGATHLVTLVEDVSDRRQTLDALRQRDAELRAALDAADAGTFAFDLTTGAIHFSPRSAELYGFGAELVVTAEAITARTHPDDRALVAKRFEAALHARADYEAEYRVVVPGRPVRWVHARGRGVIGEGGAVTHLVGVKLDVTERKLAFGRVESSEERFRLVARATRDVLYDWNVVTDDHWWSPNSAALFGHLSGTDREISAWTSRLHPDDRQRITTLLDEALRGTAELWEGEYRFRIADGTYGEFLDRGHIVRDGDGRALRMIGAMTDVTDLKRAHRSLIDAHQRLRDTSRDVHLTETRERAALARELHDEFGQLLTAAKLAASWLRSLPLDGMPAARQQQVTDKVASLCDVIDMALHGVRNVATQLRPPALDQLGLPRAIEGLAAQLERHAGLGCVVTIDNATRAHVFGPVEGAALYRIVQELVTNAARHAAASLVQVRLTMTDGVVLVTVQDDGRGFVPAGDRAVTTLGLKGVRERAELLGGRVTIDSRPGAGTTVRVTIPAGDGQ